MGGFHCPYSKCKTEKKNMQNTITKQKALITEQTAKILSMKRKGKSKCRPTAATPPANREGMVPPPPPPAAFAAMKSDHLAPAPTKSDPLTEKKQLIASLARIRARAHFAKGVPLKNRFIGFAAGTHPPQAGLTNVSV